MTVVSTQMHENDGCVDIVKSTVTDFTESTQTTVYLQPKPVIDDDQLEEDIIEEFPEQKLKLAVAMADNVSIPVLKVKASYDNDYEDLGEIVPNDDTSLSENSSSDDESAIKDVLPAIRRRNRLPTDVISNRYHPSNSPSQDDVLKNSLIKFYSKKEHMDRYLSVLSSSSPSLRLLDYFCVTYTKLNPVNYLNPNGKYFDVHASYRAQLSSYSKRMFDPFKRNKRIMIRYDNEQYLATIGQLHFFKWCLTNHVLEYVERNHHTIKEFMDRDNKAKKEQVQAVGANGVSVDINKKKKSGRRRSALHCTAIRAPARPGFERVILRF